MRLIYRFTVNKMILKISIRAKDYELTVQHDETSERGEGIVKIQRSKPDNFLRAKYEHMMAITDLIGFLQILKGLKRKAWLRAVLGACEPPRARGHAKARPP